MSTFAVNLQDAHGQERFDAVRSFVGTDATGSFGLLAGHACFMTILELGLARLRHADGRLEYLALPGALVDFRDNQLVLSTRRYYRDPDYARISALLRERLAAEEQDLAALRDSLQRLEREMLRRLWELGRGGEQGR
ncbi:F0F1 ATP synthase subunit epsilon [Thiohalocapsa marina]|uniref:ATP synthase epsilon chain n=1 Tax=Thiohalocapsa marina TaxID=424902 RepID=A0A5M8FFK1_9GAMM|nr:F0F1 ATP synthase subunit epsilon [Thiohalocapsa marina]KAA6183487.1 F0F1 ATP synthase subunit epsilon [Thiohalocapsa marina]